MKSIKELRQNGYKVKVTHMRKVKKFDPDTYTIKTVNMRSFAAKQGDKTKEHRLIANGGSTTVSVLTPTGKEYTATAVCGKRDSYCYKRGVNVCLGRINKQW